MLLNRVNVLGGWSGDGGFFAIVCLVRLLLLPMLSRHTWGNEAT